MTYRLATAVMQAIAYDIRNIDDDSTMLRIATLEDFAMFPKLERLDARLDAAQFNGLEAKLSWRHTSKPSIYHSFSQGLLSQYTIVYNTALRSTTYLTVLNLTLVERSCEFACITAKYCQPEIFARSTLA